MTLYELWSIAEPKEEDYADYDLYLEEYADWQADEPELNLPDYNNYALAFLDDWVDEWDDEWDDDLGRWVN